VAVVVNEFAFLAGSIGRTAADRIVAAVTRATAEGLPLLAATASGGTRMQEGTPGFVRMADISRALVAHRSAGLPYLVWLRHPTTGGVFASWGSLGHVTVAEPGAVIGFLGPRVVEALRGAPLPPEVQTAEHLAQHGIIDAVVGADDLAALVDRTLSILVDPPTPPSLPVRRRPLGEPAPAWDSITRTRTGRRAGARDLLRYGASDTVRLAGTDEGELDTTLVIALTRLDGQPCVYVGQDRTRQTPETPMGPGALREARRAMRLAEELRLPLVTVIDTAGAELSTRAEEGAIAGEIARCTATLVAMTVPTVSVLLGQGTGGGALALLPAQQVVAAQHAWLSPLPPEGASYLVHRDLHHAAEVAAAHRIRAVDLLADGVVHDVVPEVDGEPPQDLAVAMAAACAQRIVALRTQGPTSSRTAASC